MQLNNDQYYNRDLSWLRFNHRVLQEAADRRNPLYERIKFLAIFSSNLEEFFEVRVSDIRQIKSLDKKLRKKLITKPNKLLRQIKKNVFQLQEEYGRIWQYQLLPELEMEGLKLVTLDHFNEKQKVFITDFFEKEIAGNLKMKKGMSNNADRLFIENGKLYLVGLKPDTELVFVKIPEEKGRFVNLPYSENGMHNVCFIDDIIKYCLRQSLDVDFYNIKISRDAELYIENEFSGNLLEKIQVSLSNRDTGQVTRALIQKNMPDDLLDQFMLALDINETDISLGGKYHNMQDLFTFPNPMGKDLQNQELAPKKISGLGLKDDLFMKIMEKDRLLHFPYESFETVLHFIEQAAHDPKVRKIKMTLYRVSKDSAVANALLKALKRGKAVTVFIETKARFDEANNIKWGSVLEAHGARVIYSYPGIKVHSKILFIEREDGENTKAFAYIGTGNFNEKTSKIYTDFGLLTADKKLTRELAQVFQLLEREIIIPRVKQLMVSPFTTREKISKMIEREIEFAQEGKPAYLIFKMNSLQDNKMIKLLYKASQAGVEIRLLVRGICCLVPGIAGQSDNIKVTSIVDRYLEHARIYVFGNGGKEKMYMGSADLMTRNLDHRIEVLAPINDPDNYQKMRHILQLQLEDRVKARIIDVEQKNEYVSTEPGKSSQVLIYDYL